MDLALLVLMGSALIGTIWVILLVLNVPLGVVQVEDIDIDEIDWDLVDRAARRADTGAERVP